MLFIKRLWPSQPLNKNKFDTVPQMHLPLLYKQQLHIQQWEQKT